MAGVTLLKSFRAATMIGMELEMSTSKTKHGFWWKLSHLSFGKTDEDYARDDQTMQKNAHEPGAPEENLEWKALDEADTHSRSHF